MTRYTDWNAFFAAQMPLLKQIRSHVAADRAKGNVYPAPADVFRAFAKTPLRDVKVVILGQDPYHGAGQANGLAFSVQDGVPLPLSLKNIFRELADDLPGAHYTNGPGLRKTAKSWPYCGNLSAWTRQGVLLLNTALTVRESDAGSHLDIWQPFTDEVVRAVVGSSAHHPHFILWGGKARDAFQRALKCKLKQTSPTARLQLPDGISFGWGDYVGAWYPKDGSAYYDVTATYSAHPSPLSARGGFFGSRPFSRANLALRLNNPGVAGIEIDWRLP